MFRSQRLRQKRNRELSKNAAIRAQRSWARPVSNAIAYLFSEFDPLHILEVELFTDTHKFESREKVIPDAGIRASFDKELNSAIQNADKMLEQPPRDRNALFAEVLAAGLRGDYLALIEKRNLAGN